MKKVGITGQNGFIGQHLFNTLGINRKEFTRVPFRREYFDDHAQLDTFVKSCDVIVHLAALNRHDEAEVIYKTNTDLVKALIASMERCKFQGQVLMSSSTQEGRDNLYGKSKKDGREMLADWAKRKNGKFTGLVIPNVYGPFGSPFYNSVVSTFCHQVSRNETPKIHVDVNLMLIYIGELVDEIIHHIKLDSNQFLVRVPYTVEVKVSEILTRLQYFFNTYQMRGDIPVLESDFDLKLFNTFRCYIDIPNFFPKKLKVNIDNRGSFAEIIRLGVGGQVSFSTTAPGITRGNHFHTRKIERFSVVKGKALIQLRRIGTDEVHSFYLNGDEPAYVDMPVWYTHNITNVGNEVLYTNFWINEPYNQEDTDTWFEEVEQ